jgi:hypothetical protein
MSCRPTGLNHRGREAGEQANIGHKESQTYKLAVGSPLFAVITVRPLMLR